MLCERFTYSDMFERGAPGNPGVFTKKLERWRGPLDKNDKEEEVIKTAWGSIEGTICDGNKIVGDTKWD